MNTKILMVTSALILGVVGILFSFIPEEFLTYYDMQNCHPIFLQISGALYFGFAMINWMSKGNLIGGIYGRPIAIGNFTHFLIGALVLIKLILNGTDLSIIWIGSIAYSIFALLFGYVTFTHPNLKNASK